MVRRLTNTATGIGVLMLASALAACEGDGAAPLSDRLIGAPRPDPVAARLPSGGRVDRTALARPDRLQDGMFARPDIFSADGDVVWDGKPTLSGLWVSHSDVDQVERVRVTNPISGTVIDAALLPRRGSSSTTVVISSQAADALGMVANARTPLTMVAIAPNAAPPTVAEEPEVEVTLAEAVPEYVPDRAIDAPEVAVNPTETRAERAARGEETAALLSALQSGGQVFAPAPQRVSEAAEATTLAASPTPPSTAETRYVPAIVLESTPEDAVVEVANAPAEPAVAESGAEPSGFKWERPGEAADAVQPAAPDQPILAVAPGPTEFDAAPGAEIAAAAPGASPPDQPALEYRPSFSVAAPPVVEATPAQAEPARSGNDIAATGFNWEGQSAESAEPAAPVPASDQPVPAVVAEAAATPVASDTISQPATLAVDQPARGVYRPSFPEPDPPIDISAPQGDAGAVVEAIDISVPDSLAAAEPAPGTPEPTGELATDTAAARQAPAAVQNGPIEDGMPFVLGGYYTRPEQAADLVRTLDSLGIPAENKGETVRGNRVNRVIAGPFGTRKAREDAIQRMRAIGVPEARPIAG